jgi:hypothetical protein
MLQPYEILAPKIMSDIWFETFGMEFDKFRKEKGIPSDISIDFTNVEWVELSSLILFTNLIVEIVSDTKTLNIIFNFNSDIYPKNVLNANIFLINSSFFEAILASFCQQEYKPVIELKIRVNKKFGVNSQITNIISSYLLKKSNIKNQSVDVDLKRMSDNTSMLNIKLNDIPKFHFDLDFFKIFKIDMNSIDDIFIFPIKYICNKRIRSAKCMECDTVNLFYLPATEEL